MNTLDSLRVTLAPHSSPTLALSCADKLLWFFADQILAERELAIAYPCLHCRGGLSLFLAYLALAIDENPPGSNPEPIVVYPGTAPVREAYTGLKVRVGELLDALSRRRVQAGRRCYVHRWEENVFRAIRRGKLSRDAELPLHDFFPAALLEADGTPHIFAGRDGFGRGDEAPPPLQFATKIQRLHGGSSYRAAVIAHDAVESYSERERLKNLNGIRARSVIHIFDSPYSPSFRRTMAAGRPYWRLRPSDFTSAASPVPPDEELQRMLAAEHRVHVVESPLTDQASRGLNTNLRDLRQLARGNAEVTAAYTRLNNCYRLMAALPVPTRDFDAAAGAIGLSVLSERIDDVMEVAEAVGPGVAYALIDESVQTLRSLLDTLRADPARARALLIETRRALRDRKRLGIVVSSPIFVSAIEEYLARELPCEVLALPERGVHVTEAESLPNAAPFDALVFFGYRGPWVLRWMMSGRAKEIVAILTAQERRLVARDLQTGTAGHDSWKPRTTEAAGALRCEPGALEDGARGEPAAPNENARRAFGEPEPSASDIPEVPFDDEDFIRELLDDSPIAGHAVGEHRTDRLNAVLSVRACRRVVFDHWYAFLAVEGTITAVGPKGVIEKPVKDLAVGDIVLFVNGDQRRSIYEVMLAEIKKSPAFSLSADIIEAWQRRLKTEFAKAGMTGATLHRRLRDAGSNVVGVTVRGWLRGSVMSPLDSDNLGRLFMVFGIPDPEGRHSRRIDQAARHLRNVYRQYAKAVNAFLIRAARDGRPELDALLEKYNLDLDGVKEAVVAQEVLAIPPGTVGVAGALVGRLHER